MIDGLLQCVRIRAASVVRVTHMSYVAVLVYSRRAQWAHIACVQRSQPGGATVAAFDHPHNRMLALVAACKST